MFQPPDSRLTIHAFTPQFLTFDAPKKLPNIVSNALTICLKFFDINDDQFKNEVWIKLKEKLGLVCAFVSKKGDYSGCVLNWPNVFRHSLCSKL